VSTNDLSRERSGDEAFGEALSCVHNNFKISRLWQMTWRSVRTRESVLSLSLSSGSSDGT
jgi:hypothetical protein